MPSDNNIDVDYNNDNDNDNDNYDYDDGDSYWMISTLDNCYVFILGIFVYSHFIYVSYFAFVKYFIFNLFPATQHGWGYGTYVNVPTVIYYVAIII